MREHNIDLDDIFYRMIIELLYLFSFDRRVYVFLVFLFRKLTVLLLFEFARSKLEN